MLPLHAIDERRHPLSGQTFKDVFLITQCRGETKTLVYNAEIPTELLVLLGNGLIDLGHRTLRAREFSEVHHNVLVLLGQLLVADKRRRPGLGVFEVLNDRKVQRLFPVKRALLRECRIDNFGHKLIGVPVIQVGMELKRQAGFGGISCTCLHLSQFMHITDEDILPAHILHVLHQP